MGDLLSVKNVFAAYSSGGNEVRAVDGVSLQMRDGEVLGIAGESGCGKSTLAAVLSLGARPPLYVKSGEMTLDGERYDLTKGYKLPRELRGKLISILPQGALNSLNPTARVRDLAYDVIHAHEEDVTRAQATERTGARLEQLGLPTRVLESYPHQLSGGMKQRVVAVISTLLNPRVLIADEPTSALDVSSQKALVLQIKLLMEQKVITSVVFITHDLPMLRNVADRIAVMYAGKIAEIGSNQQIIDAGQHPYTKALIGSILVPEPYVRAKRIEGIEGQPPDLRSPPSGCRFHPRCSLADQRCTLEEPPQVGDENQFAACWRVSEQREGMTVSRGAA
jgi:peptide/nickel transport system ATP-binding protein